MSNKSPRSKPFDKAQDRLRGILWPEISGLRPRSKLQGIRPEEIVAWAGFRLPPTSLRYSFNLINNTSNGGSP